MEMTIFVDRIRPELTDSYSKSIMRIQELSRNTEFMEKTSERQHNTGDPDSNNTYQKNVDYLLKSINME